jgi:hypothetical protein
MILRKTREAAMNKAYRCEDCGSEIVQDAAKAAPDCCGETMLEIPLEACMEPGPESTHRLGGDEPCEDFTGRQR